jgi:hypothetical protein
MAKRDGAKIFRIYFRLPLGDVLDWSRPRTGRIGDDGEALFAFLLFAPSCSRLSRDTAVQGWTLKAKTAKSNAAESKSAKSRSAKSWAPLSEDSSPIERLAWPRTGKLRTSRPRRSGWREAVARPRATHLPRGWAITPLGFFEVPAHRRVCTAGGGSPPGIRRDERIMQQGSLNPAAGYDKRASAPRFGPAANMGETWRGLICYSWVLSIGP